MGIPQKNENGGREKNHQPTPTPRTQETERVGLTFPKSVRVRFRGHYQHILRAGNKFIGSLVIIDYRIGASFCPKLGITVSKRYGKAHDRNRFKRVVREAFRLILSHLPENIEMNVLPRQPLKKITTTDVLHDISQFLSRLK